VCKREVVEKIGAEVRNLKEKELIDRIKRDNDIMLKSFKSKLEQDYANK